MKKTSHSGRQSLAAVRRFQLRGRVVGVTSAAFLLLLAIVAVFSPLLAPNDPNETELSLTNAPPYSTPYLLGGDSAGRDILSRLLIATRYTLINSSVAVVVAVVIGVWLGLIAGYYGRSLDAILNWIADGLLSAPGVVVLVALYTIIGPRMVLAMAVFGVLMYPSMFRLVRALVLGVKSKEYVDAAKVSGARDASIMWRHILRVIRGPLIVQASFFYAGCILVESTLQFLGLGDPAKPSWGGMVEEAFGNIYVAPVNVLWPGGIVTLTALAFVLLGNALRDSVQRTVPFVASIPDTSGAIAKRPRVAGDPIGAHADSFPTSPLPHDSERGGGPAPLLRISGLRISYPSNGGETRSEVVRGVELTVAAGEIHGLVGESGAGKSQVAFACLGILPRSAQISADGIYLRGENLLSDRRLLRRARGREIGYVPQEPSSNLDPSFMIGHQLVGALRSVTEKSRRDATNLMENLLAQVGIRDPGDVMRMYPYQVSGGMAQRILIAGALAAEPQLVIADEPTSGLDVTVQAGLLDLLRELRDQRGLGMLLVTHDLGVVADICDTVSVMRDGELLETSPVRDFFAQPATDYGRELVELARKASIS